MKLVYYFNQYRRMYVPNNYPRKSSGGSEQNAGRKLPQMVRISFLRKSNSIEELPQIGLPDFIKRSSLLKSKCQLCQQNRQKEEMDCIADCGHLFCNECLQKYCVYKINVMEDASCPSEGCAAVIKVGGSVYERLPQTTKDKYKKMVLWKQTISNPNLRLCPTEKCEGIIDLSKGAFACQKCKVRFCQECQLPEHNGPCDSNFQRNFKDWKRCPRCHLFIQRTQGCNHMTCRCGHQFCYICLADWDDNHYECGVPNAMIMQVAEMARWKRCLLALLLIIAIPLAIALALVGIVLGTAIITLIAFVCAPCAFIANNQCLQNLCGCILYPLMMAVGAVLGLFGGFGYSIYIATMLFAAYFMLIRALLSAEEIPAEFPDDDNFVELVEV